MPPSTYRICPVTKLAAGLQNPYHYPIAELMFVTGFAPTQSLLVGLLVTRALPTRAREHRAENSMHCAH